VWRARPDGAHRRHLAECDRKRRRPEPHGLHGREQEALAWRDVAAVLVETSASETRLNVHGLAERFDRGVYHIKARHGDWLARIRQNGVVIGLEFNHTAGAKLVMRRIYEHGIWVIFAEDDPRTLRFEPGVLVHPALAEEILARTEAGIAEAHNEVHA
jgi:acetylornithine/succinyldiaminopimelate/putrescine aminotransferase